MNLKRLKERIYFQIFRIATASVVLFLFIMIWTFITNGIGVIN